MKKWENLGGKRDSLNRAIEAGKNKPIVVCGKKCRAKAGANPKVPANIADEQIQLNFAGIDDLGEAMIVAAGIGVIGTLIGVVGSGINNSKNYRRQTELMKLEADLRQKDSEQNAIDATMTPSEKKIADEIIKAQESNNDPTQAIKNNANLTAEEKAEAIKQLEGMQKSNIGIDTSKKFILLGVLLVAGFLGWQLYKNKQTN
jgi:hypothetical protein